MFLFWLTFMIIAIEDAIFYEVDLFLVVLMLIFFGYSYSFVVMILCIFFGFFFRNSEYIGEADIIITPMAWHVCDYNPIFLLILPFCSLVAYSAKLSKIALISPLILTSIITSVYTQNMKNLFMVMQ